MVKTLFFFVLLAASTSNAFAPSPTFRVQQPKLPVTTITNIAFMSPIATDDKIEIPTEGINGDKKVKVDEVVDVQEELTETQKLMKQVKESGTAGIVSYALWELAFWFFSVPVCFFGYKEVTGHWPNLSDKDDLSKLGAEAFAFVNFARFAVPLRIGLALSTTPWIQKNVIDRIKNGEAEPSEE